jgi:hypothetical protein
MTDSAGKKEAMKISRRDLAYATGVVGPLCLKDRTQVNIAVF